MVIFYINRKTAKIYLNKQEIIDKNTELLLVFSDCDSLLGYIENQSENPKSSSKLYFCDNSYCLYLINKNSTNRMCGYIKAHLSEYGRLISNNPIREIKTAIDKQKNIKSP